MTLPHIIMEVLLGDREAIRAAAIRFPDGEVFEGPFHAECWYEAHNKGKVKEDPSEGEYVDLIEVYSVEEGFTTTTGRFVGREEAFKIAVSAHQQKPEPAASPYQYLDSQDVADKYET